MLDTLLSFNTLEDECTLGSLIMSPSEQAMGVADQHPGISDREEEVTNGDGGLARVSDNPLVLKMDKNEHNPLTDPPPASSPASPPDPNSLVNGSPSQHTGHESPLSTTSGNPLSALRKDLTGITPSGDEIDSSSCLMEETAPLAIDLSCVPKVSGSKEMGPESPVIPTTNLSSQSLDSRDEPVESVGEEMMLSSFSDLCSEATSGVRVRLTTSISEPGNEALEEFSPDNDQESLDNISCIGRLTPHSNDYLLQEVSENVYSAWIPGPSTASLLSQSQPTLKRENLTCPALAADISMVSIRSAI